MDETIEQLYLRSKANADGCNSLKLAWIRRHDDEMKLCLYHRVHIVHWYKNEPYLTGELK